MFDQDSGNGTRRPVPAEPAPVGSNHRLHVTEDTMISPQCYYSDEFSSMIVRFSKPREGLGDNCLLGHTRRSEA